MPASRDFVACVEYGDMRLSVGSDKFLRIEDLQQPDVRVVAIPLEQALPRLEFIVNAAQEALR